MVPRAQASCPRVAKVRLSHMPGAGRKQLVAYLEVGREVATVPGSEAAYREAHEDGPGSVSSSYRSKSLL